MKLTRVVRLLGILMMSEALLERFERRLMSGSASATAS